MIPTIRPHVVIVGAGFGGLWAARALADQPVDVTLIDRHNYHTFLPLLYQVAAAELEPEQIAQPIRSLIRKQENVQFRLATVDQIDVEERRLQMGKQVLTYDYLILALGSSPHYFGIQGAAEHAFPLKSLEEGIALRSHMLNCFEQAALTFDPDERRQLLTFTIVGGGPTGVEYAGALMELVQGPLMRDFPNISLQEVHIVLVEATTRLLGGLPADLGDYAAARLLHMGVDVMFDQPVEAVTATHVTLKDGTSIPSKTVVWTAGVRGEPLAERLGLPIARGGRVAVTPTLRAEGHERIFAIGDLAYLEQDGEALPLLAPVAMQQGEFAARAIMEDLGGKPAGTFQYRDKGAMATIGRNKAVAMVAGRQFTGFVAWVLWLSVHLFQLIGFQNRLVVLINWAYDYLFFERVARLILPQSLRREPLPSDERAPTIV